jgi:hypothetical protein
MPWIVEHWAVILLVLSEVLPLIPAVQSNSVGQLIIALIKQGLEQLNKPKA